jgi:hypothetical protein
VALALLFGESVFKDAVARFVGGKSLTNQATSEIWRPRVKNTKLYGKI